MGLEIFIKNVSDLLNSFQFDLDKNRQGGGGGA